MIKENIVASPFNQPLGGNEMIRAGGIATMMRLPTATSYAGIDIGFIGVPFDIGTSNRTGARFVHALFERNRAYCVHTICQPEPLPLIHCKSLT